jgi:hypothetical protein
MADLEYKNIQNIQPAMQIKSVKFGFILVHIRDLIYKNNIFREIRLSFLESFK